MLKISLLRNCLTHCWYSTGKIIEVLSAYRSDSRKWPMTVRCCGNMRSRCWKLGRRYSCGREHRPRCTGRNSIGLEWMSPGCLNKQAGRQLGSRRLKLMHESSKKVKYRQTDHVIIA